MPEDKQIDLLKSLIENRHEIYERLAPRVNIVDIFWQKNFAIESVNWRTFCGKRDARAVLVLYKY